jgi:hypothetical protein
MLVQINTFLKRLETTITTSIHSTEYKPVPENMAMVVLLLVVKTLFS